MKNRNIQLLAIVLLLITANVWGQNKLNINGKIISAISREPVGYATVKIVGDNSKYSIADSMGIFKITDVQGGIYRLEATSVGYITTITPEFMLSHKTPFIEIVMEEDIALLDGVTVRSTVLERVKDAGVGKQIIGVADIEKIPGGNRDISKVIRSYPGVGYSPVGYRNDLIVRGGSPAENAFYVDGIEIPNINHFSTQGASGGPVGIINADLIEQVQFYTGALPVAQGGVLSSVMDIKLKNGNPNEQVFKASVGASEVGISGSGHFGEKTTYLFSARQSYLQFLFKLLELPFLPNYIDAQIKVKHRISPKDEIIVLALGGIDRMKLNTDQEGEEAEYMLGYLPVVKQHTYTVGSAYNHYGNRGGVNLSVNYNCLDNINVKYHNNDSSNEENLKYKTDSKEEKIGLRGEGRMYLGRWQLLGGMQGTYNKYWMHSFNDGYGNVQSNEYDTKLHIISYALYASAGYESYDKRFDFKIGIRSEGADYSKEMSKFWKNLSPRLQISYALKPKFTINGNIGLYHQLPPFTSLGYKIGNQLVNKDLEYMKVLEGSIGARWNISNEFVLSAEGFYKRYSHMPLCLKDGIPLACKGDDYGTVGNEALVSSAQGRAYGVEISARWIIAGKLNLLGSATLFNSEYRGGPTEEYYPSAWDNRYIMNCGATYNFRRNWSVGAKISSIGGAPYTPYITDESSLREAWILQGKPYYDYSKYNTLRLNPFTQIDIRIDKNWYFNKWMLGAYIDVQNVTMSKLKLQDVPLESGKIFSPKYGSIIPTIGLNVEF